MTCYAKMISYQYRLDFFIAQVWLVMAMASILVKVLPFFQSIASHGKALQSSSSANSIYDYHREGFIIYMQNLLRCLYVPKSYFKHMYILGILTFLLTLFWTIQISKTRDSNVLLSIILFGIQVTRRLYECFSITIYGNSQVHMLGYIIGLVHYILVPLTLCSSDSPEQQLSSFFSININMNQSIAVALFAFASYFQYLHHRILFNIKVHKSTTPQAQNASSISSIQYAIPQGLGFEFICCPHYALEMLIYLSFALLQTRSWGAWSMLLWVVCNLCVVADENLLWYRNNHHLLASISSPKEISHDDSACMKEKIRKWKRIIPLIW